MYQDLIKILLVEDNPGDAFLIQESLKQRPSMNFEVTQVPRLKDALSNLDNKYFDVILLDLSLPDSQGIDSFTSIASIANHLPIVVLSGVNDSKVALQAVKMGAQDYLNKDLVIGESLIYSLCYAIERQRMQEERKQQKKQLELANQELEKRTEELEILNQELEAFSYTVSHDLRSPLLTIDGFLFFLENQLNTEFNSQSKHYLQRIRQAVNRMETLIENLLNLSRVQKIGMEITEVNLSEIVQEIAEALKFQDLQRKVEFQITPNLIAPANSDLLSIALENLISNAWKYTAQEEVACIKFGVLSPNEQILDSFAEKHQKRLTSMINSIQTGRTRIYFIQDNGVGFDMCQAHQLFKAFQRLDTSGQFKGTGIGLATVQRIIHRHHGQIWATSGLGEGSTFYFTLNSTHGV